MSKNKHTKGPWKITGPFPQDHRVSLLHVKCSRGEDDVALVGFDHTNKHDESVARADANLISAAPSLLAACEELIGNINKNMTHTSIHNDRFEGIRAAVRAAKGGAH